MIKSSNLCAEILLHSSATEYAVCNLGSLVLHKYYHNDKFDFELLEENARFLVRLLNKVIDTTHYSLGETKKSNLSHRPIGVGVQGLADLFIKMRTAFKSHVARTLNKKIFEHIYFACAEGSIELARKRGQPYESYPGSPLSKGKFQFDMWQECHPDLRIDLCIDAKRWQELREKIAKHGVLNSTFTACMPTVSTANIIGSTESIEPIDRCVFKRLVWSGSFTSVHVQLQKDLMRSGLWSKDMFDKIVQNNGKVTGLSDIPISTQEIYRSVWDMSMRTLFQYSADRAPFICMTQSLNLFHKKPTSAKLFKMHMFAWQCHLKTGIYYLKSEQASNTIKYSIKECDDSECCM